MEDFDAVLKVLSWVSGIVVSVGVPVGIAIITYIVGQARAANEKASEVEASLNDFRVEVAKTYVSNEQMEKLENRMDMRFSELREFLKNYLTVRR